MANALLDLRSADTASLMNDLACDQDMMASILSTIHMPSINIEPMGFGVSEQLPSPTAGLQISAGLLRGKAQKSTENAQRANMIEQWTRQLQDRRLQLNLAGLHVELKNIDKQMDVQWERIKTIEIDMRAQQKNISLRHLNAEAMLSMREVWKTTFSLEFVFDYKTISDVIIHLRYTAKNGGDTLRSAVEQSLDTSIKDAAKNTQTALFDMKNDAPDAWQILLSSQSERAVAQMHGLKSRLPYLARSQDIKVTSVKIYAGGQDLKEASISLSSTREQAFGSSATTLKYADDLGKLEVLLSW
ncbi:hypothetical protein K4K48_011644 [Colletotrichum sp. SAR 10_66]|nr:hypothetical protein K4K48_011644 [Colletotrichum sp. SAR 10_66]